MMLSVFLLAAFVAILAYGLRTAIQVEVDSTLGHRRPLSSAAPSVGPPEPIAVLAIASRVRPIEAVSGRNQSGVFLSGAACRATR